MSIEIFNVPDVYWNHKYNNALANVYVRNSGVKEFLEYIFNKFNYENLFYNLTYFPGSPGSTIELKFSSYKAINDELKEDTTNVILRISSSFYDNDGNMSIQTISKSSDSLGTNQSDIWDVFKTNYYRTKTPGSNLISPCYRNFGSYTYHFLEYNILSGILATPNCISFEFRFSGHDYENSFYDVLKPSTFQLVLSKTKKGNWAVITPFASPINQSIYYQRKYDSTNGITEETAIGYSKNNIVCYSLNSLTTDKFDFTPGDLGKESTFMSFDTIPVIGDNDWCQGCYFNFYSNVTEPGIIDVDGKKFYFNGWLSMEE